MAQHRRSLSAARPIAAGPIFPDRESAPISLRPGKGVVTSGCIAHAGDHGTPFRQRSLHVEFVVIAVKIVNALRNGFALEVPPGPGPIRSRALMAGLPSAAWVLR